MWVSSDRDARAAIDRLQRKCGDCLTSWVRIFLGYYMFSHYMIVQAREYWIEFRVSVRIEVEVRVGVGVSVSSGLGIGSNVNMATA